MMDRASLDDSDVPARKLIEDASLSGIDYTLDQRRSFLGSS